jgi:DNA-binding GntR family transcriptional regulator
MKDELDLKSFDLEPLTSLPTRRSLGHHIFTHLKKAILRGDIPPGNRLVENRIAKDLGISRTPVREAFHKLEREGLIKLIPRGGYAVTGLTKEDIEDIFGIRSLLESYAAALTAKNHKENEVLLLEEKNKEFQRCLDQNELEKLPKINTEFHDLLYALSGRPLLIKMISQLQAQIYRFRKMILIEKKNAQISIKLHQALLNALKKRDAEQVERLLKKHILRGQKIVLKALKNKVGEF